MKGLKSAITKAWKFLDGKKRRIGLAMALAANYVGDPTISICLNIGAVLLGGADSVNVLKQRKGSGNGKKRSSSG